MPPSGATPLHRVADPASPSLGNDSPATIAELVAAGADLDARDEFGDTPLHYAAALSNPGAAKALIRAGADVNARGQWDFTPLHCAAQSGDPAVIAALVEAGADAEARDRYGSVPSLCWDEATSA